MRRQPDRYCAHCGSLLITGERFGRLRPVCPTCGRVVFYDPKVAVVIFVTEGDRLLLVKRSNDPGSGRWALPAGFVDADEDPMPPPIRETHEETGLIVAVDRLIDLFHRPDADGLADIVIAYQAHALGGSLAAADDADDAAWFPRDHLPEIALATTEALIARWRAGEL